MTITKSDLINQIHTTTALSKRESIQATETVIETIKSTLESGKDVLISGFGKFKAMEKNPRKGRNPQTGNDLTLDARRVVTFKCSGVLRGRLNGKPKIKKRRARK